MPLVTKICFESLLTLPNPKKKTLLSIKQLIKVKYFKLIDHEKQNIELNKLNIILNLKKNMSRDLKQVINTILIFCIHKNILN